MSLQCLPPSLVLKTWPGRLGVAWLKPLNAAYAIRSLDRSTAISLTGRFGKMFVPTRAHVGDVFVTASGLKKTQPSRLPE